MNMVNINWKIKYTNETIVSHVDFFPKTFIIAVSNEN